MLKNMNIKKIVMVACFVQVGLLVTADQEARSKDQYVRSILTSAYKNKSLIGLAAGGTGALWVANNMEPSAYKAFFAVAGSGALLAVGWNGAKTVLGEQNCQERDGIIGSGGEKLCALGTAGVVAAREMAREDRSVLVVGCLSASTLCMAAGFDQRS